MFLFEIYLERPKSGKYDMMWVMIELGIET